MLQERTGVRAGILLTEAEVQFAFSTYHEIMGPLGDMSELAIQFGYVTMFVVVFPITPVRMSFFFFTLSRTYQFICIQRRGVAWLF